MSASDIERFVADLKENTEMLGELQESSTGLAHVIDYAKGKGYDISLDDAKAYIKAQAKMELDEAQLDAVAAGKADPSGGGSPGPSHSTGYLTTNVNASASTYSVIFANASGIGGGGGAGG